MKAIEILKQTRSELKPETDFGWGTDVVTEAMERYAKLYHESEVKKLSLSAVSGMLIDFCQSVECYDIQQGTKSIKDGVGDYLESINYR
jgi:hypothetical protein